jgi:hypothetical protein
MFRVAGAWRFGRPALRTQLSPTPNTKNPWWGHGVLYVPRCGFMAFCMFRVAGAWRSKNFLSAPPHVRNCRRPQILKIPAGGHGKYLKKTFILEKKFVKKNFFQKIF